MKRNLTKFRRGLRATFTALVCSTWTAGLLAQTPTSAGSKPARNDSCTKCHSGQPTQPPPVNIVTGEAMDEPMGGQTLKGTPVTQRLAECFPAEQRDVFWQMDMVPGGTNVNAPLRPLNFDTDGNGAIDDKERDAIRGRNTWVMWCGGNEGFWNWLSQDGYGITDFLVLLDSRKHNTRFAKAGLINQPGFQANSDPSKRILGLYLDVPVGENVANSDLTNGYSSHGHVLAPPPWETAPKDPGSPHKAPIDLFEPGDRNLYETTKNELEAMGDGVNYSIYGYPSGIVGLRLFLNPDFFGKGKDPEKARDYWTNQITKPANGSERYYSEIKISQDPKLVRPFRVGMSCGFCHVAPHPLNPPADFEKPDWANLSTTIGNQFWTPQNAFSVLLNTNNFLYHFLASQQPGTIDTSLVSSDQINNANTINAVFDVNPRLARAALNPTERQSPANVLLRSIEDAGLPIKGDGNDWRHTPRVLLDGSDSIGIFGALVRVYVNIGTFYEEWMRCDNLVIGYKPQRPFRIDVCQRNSVYWQANERYRAGYLASFFTMANSGNSNVFKGPNPPSRIPHTSTQPMKLADAKQGDGVTPDMAARGALKMDATDVASRENGRIVWLDNCAICHSGKQPDGFALSFERKKGAERWDTEPAPKDAQYVLPMDQADWVAYKRSPNYQDYRTRLLKLVGPLKGDPLTDHHPFWQDNYLSTDIRVPVTLTGTPTGRAMACNGLTNQVWDNFSSITYKELPAVGPVDYFNPISGKEATFDTPGGGRGYYRPATLVSIWATAPYLHNNALGCYLDDPSVAGRLVQFSDGIRRLLWSEQRASPTPVLAPKEWDWLAALQKDTNSHLSADLISFNKNTIVSRYGDLRAEHGKTGAAANDTGFIYRIPNDTYVEIASGFIRPLVEGVVGPSLTKVLSVWLWVGLFVLLALLSWARAPRYLGLVFIVVAIVAVPLAVTSIAERASAFGLLLTGIGHILPFTSLGWAILVLTFVGTGIACIQSKIPCLNAARYVVAALLAGIALALLISGAVWLGLIALAIGGFGFWVAGKWTLPGLSGVFFAVLAAVTLLIGIAVHQYVNGRAIYAVFGPYPIKAGPIPQGTPVNLIMNLDPMSPNAPAAVVALGLALAEIQEKKLTNNAAWQLLSERAGQPLMNASKCPDFTLDRGHLFGETLDADPIKNNQDKEDLIAFLKTL